MRRYLFVDRPAHDREIDENVRNLGARATTAASIIGMAFDIIYHGYRRYRDRIEEVITHGQIDYYYYYYPVLSLFFIRTTENISDYIPFLFAEINNIIHYLLTCYLVHDCTSIIIIHRY
uniref:Uncharacterized protein n=1 Tax=Schizaphis graminum TaxID=13262 RepID=A0A2S2NLU7_SCHGA